MTRYTKIRDFHASRLTGVGASDIPTLAGLNKKYGQTPYTLWRLKVGLDKSEDAGPRAEWGHRLEGMVLAKFIESRYGADAAADYLARKLRGQSSGPFKTETEARMPERNYVLAHADLVVDGVFEPVAEGVEGIIGEPVEPYLVEAKTAGLMSARRDDDDPDSGYSRDNFTQDGIPASVFLQVQYQMLAYGVRVAYVAALIDTGDYREYGPILADPRVQEKCLALSERFWKLVESRQEPKPELWSDVALMWPTPEEKTAMLGGEEEMRAREMIGEYHRLKARGKEDGARLAEIKDALGIYLGENATLCTAEGVKLATSWTVTVDYAKPAEIKKKHPDWYEALKDEGLMNEATRRELRPAKI